MQSLPPRAFAPITNLYSLDLRDCRISKNNHNKQN